MATTSRYLFTLLHSRVKREGQEQSTAKSLSIDGAQKVGLHGSIKVIMLPLNPPFTVLAHDI
jgi:hypothetical protein